jgi:hypothetical protein
VTPADVDAILDCLLEEDVRELLGNADTMPAPHCDDPDCDWVHATDEQRVKLGVADYVHDDLLDHWAYEDMRGPR